MSKVVCFTVLFSAWILLNPVISAVRAEKAEWLLRYDKKTKQFELNENVLANISRLHSPIKVISAIGDARIGKSTTLNFVRHAWEINDKENKDGGGGGGGGGGGDEKEVEEVFKTGDEHQAVTRGIWISIFQEKNEDNIILLDVEGLDLGDDTVTNHMSMFTALISSGFGVFCSGTVTNHIIDFLYTLPRMSEEVFKGIDEGKTFGHLHVVIRRPLKLPHGVSLEDYVKRTIFTSSEEEGTDKRKGRIAKYFGDKTTVSELPLVAEQAPTKQNQKYWNSIKSLSGRFKTFPAKKTVGGALVDGTVLAQITRILTETMTNNSWMDIGDTFRIIEKLVCNRSYHMHIAPVLRMNSLAEIQNKDLSALEKFNDECVLSEEVKAAHKELNRRIEELRISEKRDEELKKTKDKLREETRRREEAERRNREEKCFKPDSCGWSWTWIAGTVAAALPIAWFLSDARLKRNIITLSPSKYQVLGLREVAWIWNEDAQRLGLSGEARGVIAQEVEQLYPWAVLTGYDGYKRVNYAALDLMVALVSNKHIARLVNINNGDVKGKPPLPGDEHDRSVAH